MTFLDLLKACNDNSNIEVQQEALNQANESMSDPEIINHIIEVISDINIPSQLRQHASLLMYSAIRNNLNQYVEKAQEIFNGLLESMLNETDTLIAKNVSHSLYPIFQSYGEEWEAMDVLIKQACTSEKKETCIVGSIFLTEFIPCTRNAYIAEMHEIIIPLLKNLLSSYSPDIIYGFKLFESLQMKDYEKDPQTNIEYASIFQDMLQLYHRSLVEKSNFTGAYSQCIGHSIMSDIPFDSPTNIFQNLFQIASDESISLEYRHYPLFPIKSLIKYHGSELKPVIPQIIETIITISASQFQNLDYIGEDSSRSIIVLFEHISTVMNGDEFYQYLMSIVSQEADPASSFASLCALYGSSEGIVEQFEQNMSNIVAYIFSKLSIESKPVIEICLIMFSDFVDRFSNSINSSINEILSAAFNYATIEDEDISKDAILLISMIFENIDLETSTVLTHLNSLKDFYVQSPSLKPEIMGAIGSAIYSIGEDFKPYAQSFIEIIGQGLSSDDQLLVISSVEALGYLIRYASDQIDNMYSEGIEFILAHTKDDDLNMKDTSLTALYNIINQNSTFNLDAEKYKYFIHTVLAIANMSIGITYDDNDIYSDDNVKPQSIIECGFILIRALLKYHYEVVMEIELSKALPKQFNDFLKFTDKDIAITAIKASVYFMIHLQPEGTDLLSIYLQILQGEDIDRCQAIFKAYNKLLEAQYAPAINEEILSKFVNQTVSALSRNLMCQRMNCNSEDERFNFDYTLLEPAYSILNESFKINAEFYPSDQFLELMNFLLSKVDDTESLEILGTLGSYIMAGGTTTAELVQYAFSKLEDLSYQKGADAIFFIRAVIKNHPAMIGENAETLTQFFTAQLKTDVSDKQYYWAIMMNVISAVFEMFKSEAFSSLINMDEFLPLILNKLPVQGDLEEGEFIYSSLIEYLSGNENAIGNNVSAIFKVLILTLSSKSSQLEDLNLPKELVDGMVELIKLIMKNQPDIDVAEVLDNDEVRMTRIKARLEEQ